MLPEGVIVNLQTEHSPKLASAKGENPASDGVVSKQCFFFLCAFSLLPTQLVCVVQADANSCPWEVSG